MGIESALLIETPPEIFLRVYRQLRPYARVPEVRVEFRRFANANSFIRLEEGLLAVRITDVLEGAPSFVLEALAHFLISKLARKKPAAVFSERYRRYLNRKEMRRSLHLVRQTRGRKVLGSPQGQCYDLEAIFEDLNFRFFYGLMARPILGWSVRVSHHTLGHYDPSHNAIVLSKILDRESVPKLAVEYVMFHEMLHLRFPVEHRALRRCVHTQEFKEAEKQFPEWEKAKELLKKL
jgi:hypothetical protein